MRSLTVAVAVAAVVLAGAVTARAQDDGAVREVQLPVVSMPDRPVPPANTPRLDVSVSCAAAAAVAVSAGRDKEACLSDEQEAKLQLDKDWPASVLDDKSLCFGNVKSGGPPSYVELLSCINVMKDYRQIRESDPLMTAEIEQPLPPALPHHYRSCREPLAVWCIRPAGRLWFGDQATLEQQDRGARRSRRHLGDAVPVRARRHIANAG